MTHFGSILHSSLTGGFIEGTTTNTGQSILGGGTGEGVESGLSLRNITNRIQDLVDRNLVQSTQFQFENVQVPIFDLKQQTQALGEGLVSSNNSFLESIQSAFSAITENANIREDQRAFDQNTVSNLQEQISNIGGGDGSNPLAGIQKFIDENPFFGGLGSGALLAGAAILGILILK